MSRLHVCPLSRLEAVVAREGAGHLVTLHTPGTPVSRPAGIAPEAHLVLAFSDVTQAQDGHLPANRAQVEALLAFARAWPRARTLVIHCYAGISRSTAAALTVACALAPERDEAEVAWALRRASPSATPNPRLVALADAVLGREGRMIGALAAIGRGAEAFEGEPFAMPLSAGVPSAPVAQMHPARP